MMDSADASPAHHAGTPVLPQRLEELAREAFVPGGVLSRAAEAFLPLSESECPLVAKASAKK